MRFNYSVLAYALVYRNCILLIHNLSIYLVVLLIFGANKFSPAMLLALPALALLFIDLNPLYHFVEIVRAPLLGEVPAVMTWIAVAIITVVGWGVTFVFFDRFRKRIAYWS